MPGELVTNIDKILETIDEALGDTVSDVQEPQEPEDADVDHGEDSYNPQEDSPDVPADTPDPEAGQQQASEQPDEPGESEDGQPDAGDPDGGKS